MQDLGDVAFFLHFEVDNSFIGFDTAERFTRCDFVTDFFVPFGDVTL